METKNTIQQTNTISEAIKLLHLCKIKTLIVLDKNKFIGTITDGDIRRGLLKQISLDSDVLKITNKKSITTFSKILDDKFKKKIIRKKIYCVPIIKKDKNYIDYHYVAQEKDNLLKKDNLLNSDTCCVIMAGGKGKRLLPLTKKIPKPLVKIKNKPMIEVIIKKILRDQFNKIYITTNYMAEKIEKFLMKRKYKLHLNFVREKKEMGTIGSLSKINFDKYNHCIVTNSDVLSNFVYSDILNYHKLNNADLTICTYFKKIISNYGNLTTKGKMISNIIEKPTYVENISIGIYVIKTKLLKLLKKNTYCDVPDFINLLIKKKKKVMSFPLYENWIDIGNLENLKIARKKFNKNFE